MRLQTAPPPDRVPAPTISFPYLFPLFLSLISFPCHATPVTAPPDRLTVDAGVVERELPHNPIGINVDYLVDDDRNRPDVRGLAAALKEMHVKWLRYPGGEKSDSYLWSVPPYSKPVPTIARWGDDQWPATDHTLVNPDRSWKTIPLDFDTFMGVARAAGAEPVLVVCFDAQFGPPPKNGSTPSAQTLLDTAVAWVRYANITKRYGVKYWELGNESYLGNYDGSATAEEYGTTAARFARAMKEVDPSVRIGINGPGFSDGVGDTDKKAGNRVTWWKVVLAHAGADADFLVIHEYPCWEWGGYERYRTSITDLARDGRSGRDTIAKYAPVSARNRLRVALTEMNALDFAKPPKGWPNRNDLGHALVLADQLGSEILNPWVDQALVWCTRWVKHGAEPSVADALDDRNQLQPTGQVLALWNEFLRDRLVRASGSNLVRIFATAARDGSELNLLIINKDTAPHPVEIALAHADGLHAKAHWVFTGSGPGDMAPRRAQAAGVEPDQGVLRLTLPAVSFSVLSLAPHP